MRGCPVCWVRRKVSDRRMRVVTELRLSDGSVQRTDVSLKEHRAHRIAWPVGAKLVFTTCRVGRRAARRVSAESLREETERLFPHLAFAAAKRPKPLQTLLTKD